MPKFGDGTRGRLRTHPTISKRKVAAPGGESIALHGTDQTRQDVAFELVALL